MQRILSTWEGWKNSEHGKEELDTLTRERDSAGRTISGWCWYLWIRKTRKMPCGNPGRYRRDEASIFAGDLYRMYNKFCRERGWKVELWISRTEPQEVSRRYFQRDREGVTGRWNMNRAYTVSNGFRRRRAGRVHTLQPRWPCCRSKRVWCWVKPSDIRKDTFCSSGPGGQSVNTTYSAIRLNAYSIGNRSELPGWESQIKNLKRRWSTRSRCMKWNTRSIWMRSRRKGRLWSHRRRSAKIRTTTTRQSRVTDHRINLYTLQPAVIMDGDVQRSSKLCSLPKIAESFKRSSEFKFPNSHIPEFRNPILFNIFVWIKTRIHDRSALIS